MTGEIVKLNHNAGFGYVAVGDQQWIFNKGCVHPTSANFGNLINGQSVDFTLDNTGCVQTIFPR